MAYSCRWQHGITNAILNMSATWATGSHSASWCCMTGMAAMLRTLPSHVPQVIRGEWDVAAVASQAWDIADKVVGTVGGGRIGRGLIRRLKVKKEGKKEKREKRKEIRGRKVAASYTCVPRLAVIIVIFR